MLDNSYFEIKKFNHEKKIDQMFHPYIINKYQKYFNINQCYQQQFKIQIGWTMDSPAFGSSNKPQNIFKATSHHNDSSQDIKYIQNSLVLLTIEKNIRKLISVLKSVECKKKQACFQQIKYREIQNLSLSHLISSSQNGLVMEIDRKISSAFSTIQASILRQKIFTWRQISSYSALRLYGEQRRMRLIHDSQKEEVRSSSQRRNNRGEEWKQNSTSNGLDLAMENKKLKAQLTKQQMEQQSFIFKMKALLDTHEKEKSKIQSKKKK